jgi:hypothetical protein
MKVEADKRVGGREHRSRSAGSQSVKADALDLIGDVAISFVG